MTGVDADAEDSADNALTINETRGIMAQFRIRELGSQPNFVFLPEIQLAGSDQTYVTVANPNTQTAAVEVLRFHGRCGVGCIPSDPLHLGPFNWARLDLKDCFPGVVDQIAWVQVGSNRALDVFGEIVKQGVRTAYWASNGLTYRAYVPHVAKNTTQFETTDLVTQWNRCMPLRRPWNPNPLGMPSPSKR